jgi:hypothetical protein
LSSATLALWLLTIFVELLVVSLFAIHGMFLKFLFVNSLLFLSAACGICRYIILSRYGAASDQYFYIYFVSEALLTALLLLSICEAGVRAVGAKHPRRAGIAWSASILLATACFTYLMIRPLSVAEGTKLVGFFVEFSSDTFFVCFLTCLWFYG